MKKDNYYVALFIISVCLFTGCSTTEKIAQKTVKLSLNEIKNSRFIIGMQGAENLCLDRQSMSVYVSDIAGYITLLDGNSFKDLKIIKSVKKGQMIFGLAKSNNNYLYAGICNYDVEGWKEKGGGIYRLSQDLETSTKITTDYPGINGITIDNNSQLYFASSNFNFVNPKGDIYKIDLNNSIQPSIYIKNAGLANGLCFDSKSNLIYYTDTLKGVYSFTSKKNDLVKIFKPQSFMGAIDDIGTDSKGRLWITEPGSSFIQCFDPISKKLVRFIINDIGQTSSCRVRSENGEDVLYVTELKISKKEYDGRGLVIIPVKSINQHLN